ncbi:MAG: DUF1684 domain-containing protein [Dechloromonas sp.]|nr:DUF1684 domain-containing protein [Candidatus Dechloromonas phosphoritropha]MBP8787381.1 DUF1684 domain-containing protein [Azonexus sp.]MBP9227789.1 DUF1684 domain-containing protein [Azonexus sp.]
MSVSDKEVFFAFRDASRGRETYGAGCFLKAPAAVDGKIALEFNFICKPPCAITPFATCPLSPRRTGCRSPCRWARRNGPWVFRRGVRYGLPAPGSAS